MIKRILPIVLLLPVFTAFGQSPTLYWWNVGPVVHDTFATVVCDTTGVAQGLAGTSMSWTFSGLTPSTVILPNRDTAGVAYFGPTNAGWLALETAATPAGATATFNASTYAIQTRSGKGTTYEQTSATAISQTGVYVDSGDLAVYSNPMDLLRLPFTYGNNYVDTFAGGVLFTPSGLSPVVAFESGTVTVSADGYGTLILPGPVSYTNVLRVHSSQSYRDSANLFGTPVIQTYDLESYTWYQPGYHSPLLTIAMASSATVHTKTVTYAARQIANHDAVPRVADIQSSVRVYPNPATGALFVSYNNATNSRVTTTIEDVTGRVMGVVADQATNGLTQLSYNTTGLASGTYFICVRSAEGLSRQKLEVVH